MKKVYQIVNRNESEQTTRRFRFLSLPIYHFLGLGLSPVPITKPNLPVVIFFHQVNFDPVYQSLTTVK